MGDSVKIHQVIATLGILILLVSPLILAQPEKLATDVHRIDVVNLFISEKYLTCSKDIYTVIELKNNGVDTEYVHLELTNHQLGIDEFAPIFMMPPNKLTSITIPIKREQEPEEGPSEFEILLYYSNEFRRYFKTFTFYPCPEEPKQTPSALSLATQENQQNPVLQPSAQLWYVVAMVILIFILALIYLLKLYIERIRERTS